MKRVLVGVDTSPASVEALRRAVQEARWQEAVLEVMLVFDPPEQVTAFPVPPAKGRDQAPDLEVERSRVSERLRMWLEELDVDLSGLNVEWSVIADRRAARALIERSAEADLVVVGSRGHGGFAGLKLGSVSEQVTRHANAPVLVVREATS